MKTKSKSVLIYSTPKKAFDQMDDFSKTGMHMNQGSMMMMGSKLRLENLSENPTGIGAKYRWFGKMMGVVIDFSIITTKWHPYELKEWETFGKARMVIMSWYRMGFVVTPADGGANVSLSISYLPPKKWLGKLLSFLFADWYCDWCLQNMLKDTKSSVEIQHPLNGKA